MGARWYNPAAGSFGNKGTVANRPVPDSASASPFGYAADSPLDRTDPTGHYVTAYSGPLTPAEVQQEARIQKASITAAANAGARQAAAARTAVLDAHQLHLLHLAHLAAAGQSAKAAPVKKPAAAPVKPYDGPVTCAEGALTQCITQAYAAGGGQYDANGIPNGKGYVPPSCPPPRSGSRTTPPAKPSNRPPPSSRAHPSPLPPAITEAQLPSPARTRPLAHHAECPRTGAPIPSSGAPLRRRWQSRTRLYLV